VPETESVPQSEEDAVADVVADAVFTAVLVDVAVESGDSELHEDVLGVGDPVAELLSVAEGFDDSDGVAEFDGDFELYALVVPFTLVPDASVDPVAVADDDGETERDIVTLFVTEEQALDEGERVLVRVTTPVTEEVAEEDKLLDGENDTESVTEFELEPETDTDAVITPVLEDDLLVSAVPEFVSETVCDTLVLEHTLPVADTLIENEDIMVLVVVPPVSEDEDDIERDCDALLEEL
jgi:hypothetical protein